MTFRLTGIENEYAFELRPGTVMVVGRAVNSDCPVVDATVSRRHAELAVSGTGAQVKDVGSSNGTFVNGVKVESHFVVPGDTVTFGKVAFRFEAVAPPVPVQVAPPAAVVAPPGATIVRDRTTPGAWALFAGIPRSQIIAAP